MIQVSSNDILVKDKNNEEFRCKLAGKFRLKNRSNANFIRVGDLVKVSFEDDNLAVIDKVIKRKSKFSRLKPHSKNEEQIIASNIDQILIFVSFADPFYKTGFIDRFLMVAEHANLPVGLCFNKADLTEIEIFEDELIFYQSITDHLFITSVADRIGIEDLENFLKGKITVVTGPSGVGKSSIINEIESNLSIRTTDVSDYSHKGQHTTTVSHYYELERLNGSIIDTPGLREFGIFGIEKEEVKNFYRDFFKLSEQCKYHNCLHLNEPHCAVKIALENDEIPYFRYESYLSMYHELDERDKNFYK